MGLSTKIKRLKATARLYLYLLEKKINTPVGSVEKRKRCKPVSKGEISSVVEMGQQTVGDSRNSCVRWVNAIPFFTNNDSI